MSVAAFSKKLKKMLSDSVYPLIKGSGKEYREERKQEFHVMEISKTLLVKGDTVDTDEKAKKAFSDIKKNIPSSLLITKDTFDKYMDQIHNGIDHDIKLFTSRTRVYKTGAKVVVFANTYPNLQAFVRKYVNPNLQRNAQLGHTVGNSYGEYNDVSSLSRIQSALDNFQGENQLNKTELLNIKKLRTSITKSYRDIHLKYSGSISKNVDISKGLANGNVTFALVVPQSARLNERTLGVIENRLATEFKRDILNMEGSKPIIKSIDDQLNQKFLTNKTTPEKSKASTKGKKTLKRKGKTTKTTTYTLPKIRNAKGQFTSTLKIKELLQPLVTAAVGMNMNSANYFKTQTGRFTKSVRIEDVIQSDRNVIVKYNYMKYPYSVFESGGSHHRAGREPTNIISGSIRQAATQLVGKKFNVRAQLKDY